jgi:outer membrane protein assembly factor BamB
MSTAYTPEPVQTTDNTTHTERPKVRKPLRLWPGVIAAVLLVLLRFVIPTIVPNVFIAEMPVTLLGTFGALLASLAIFLWWLFFSRAPWLERLGAFVVMIVAMPVTYKIVHESIAGGSMGYLLPVIAIPIVSLALVVGAVASRRLATAPRRALMVVTILVAYGVFALIRTGGFTGNFDHDFNWRWSKTPEQRLLAQGDEPTAATSATVATAKTGAEWPGFRGAERDGIVRSVRIETDWSKSPPVEMWRRPIGPGWSSFAVSGNALYTQEQRGNDEDVTCYNLTTGKPVWRHRDAARFWESNAGAGPRGTPTFSNGRLYTLGATGIVNALDANTGAVVWTRNAASDTKTKIPGWGFSGSPLVVDDLVIIAAAGNLIAYNVANGEPRWSALGGGGGYSSPHLVTINGIPQILLLNANGALSVAPADGKRLWNFELSPSARITQPAMTAEGDVLVNEGEGSAMRRISVTQGTEGWTVKERWTSYGVNPYYNDFAVHDGHAYGFVGNGVSCIDLKEGELKWKGGKYGHGQLILLRDQSLLIVLTEDGDIALVKAAADQFTELGRVPAIKSKTWNHPALVGDVLLVRNGEEMAAFKLTRARTKE